MSSYQPTWSSLATHPTPRWFLDAKVGVYTHWGPYSVAAYGTNGTWYPRHMYDPERPEYRYHSETFGPPEQVGYKELIGRFTADKFDADEWAELFAASGARFAGPVAEHHDGFSMWDSKINGWNAARMGPKRDVTGELATAIRSRGMKFAATFHHAQNWYMFPTDDQRYDCADPRYRELYTGPHAADARPDEWFLDRWEGKLYEVIDGYRPDLIWFDFGLGFIREQRRKRFLAYYYNKEREWGSGVVVTFKEIPKGWFNLPPMTGVADLELGRMWELTNHIWLTDTTVDAHGVWSYVKDAGYKSVERLIHNLVDRVSKNGHLLLNVGPRPDGTIPEQAADCLRGMGRWLDVNGEAIYGTTPWVSFGEGPTQREGSGHFTEKSEPRFTAEDIRFTTKDDAVYAICLGRPGDAITIKALRLFYEDEVAAVTALGVPGELRWRRTDAGMTIDVPHRLCGEHAFTFKVQLAPAT